MHLIRILWEFPAKHRIVPTVNDSSDFMYYDSPVGVLTVTAVKSAVVSINFGKVHPSAAPPYTHDRQNTPFLNTVCAELDAWFSGKTRRFSVPPHPIGTPFQLSVWEAIAAIPYGECRNYREIARAIGRPNAARAVGGACNRNPIPIIIPCHRVIGADGSLTGFAGGLEIKRTLLCLEQTYINKTNPVRPS